MAAVATAESAVPQHILIGWPRLKMGVAAGTPQSVCPDYMGRADYHGHAVNMAARWVGWVGLLNCFHDHVKPFEPHGLPTRSAGAS